MGNRAEESRGGRGNHDPEQAHRQAGPGDFHAKEVSRVLHLSLCLSLCLSLTLLSLQANSLCLGPVTQPSSQCWQQPCEVGTVPTLE